MTGLNLKPMDWAWQALKWKCLTALFVDKRILWLSNVFRYELNIWSYYWWKLPTQSSNMWFTQVDMGMIPDKVHSWHYWLDGSSQQNWQDYQMSLLIQTAVLMGHQILCECGVLIYSVQFSGHGSWISYDMIRALSHLTGFPAGENWPIKLHI